jgi:arylsulfatase A-like enzyme
MSTDGGLKRVIGRHRGESKPHWDEPVRAAEGSPNVLLIVLDDVGFAQLGCYGSDITTPNMDRLAEGGLMYTNFHTTAMCSPTRSCLLTGRNHHSNGMACITELATGFPGYNAIIPKENGFLSEMLAVHGYASYALGKWHLTPDEECNLAATRERWPLGRGFERFYGFLGGHTDQYVPNLVHDNHQVSPPKPIEEGYHLTEDLVDQAIGFVTDLRNADPNKPFFLYFAPGAMHAPHQAPREWIDKYDGKFDKGWEKWRAEVYERQLETGVIPAGTELPSRPSWIPDWDSLPDAQRRLYARFMEVFAGFLEHTDHHIGRLLDFLKELGEHENTLVLLVSDNGASSEGGPHGSINEARLYNWMPYTLEENLEEIDKLGGPESFPNYPWGWAWAGNTPLKRWKREVHEGGVADPMIVSWPAGLAGREGKRRQYVHAIDIVPTVLDVLGIDHPAQIQGIEQTSIEGTSCAYTFHDAGALDRHTTQYYEMMGCRGIYRDGWKAVVWHRPRIPGMKSASFDDDQWELYHVVEDFSESHDLAEQCPEKLRELQDLWWAEAGRHQVLPLDDRGTQRFFEPRPKPFQDRDEYIYYPFGSSVGEGVAADVKNRSHAIVAEVDIPEAGAEGVLLAHGGRYGGYTLYLKDRRLHYVHNLLGLERYKISSTVDVPIGPCSLGFRFEKTETEDLGAGGIGRLFIDDKEVGRGEIPRTVGVRYHLADDGLCCGYDSQTPTSDDYHSPFCFTGTLKRVIVTAEGQRYSNPELEYKIALARQ